MKLLHKQIVLTTARLLNQKNGLAEELSGELWGWIYCFISPTPNGWDIRKNGWRALRMEGIKSKSLGITSPVLLKFEYCPRLGHVILIIGEYMELHEKVTGEIPECNSPNNHERKYWDKLVLMAKPEEPGIGVEYEIVAKTLYTGPKDKYNSQTRPSPRLKGS